MLATRIMELKVILIMSSCLFGLAVGELLEQDRQVTELEAQQKTLSNELDGLRRKFDAYVSFTEKQNRKFLEIVQTLQETARNNDPINSEKLERVYRSTVSNQVAFTAIIEDKLENIPVGTTVVFEKLIHWTAEAATYDTQTGVFTCPQAGLYLFSVFIQSATHKEALVQLMLDGKPYTSAVSEPSTDGEDDSGGNLVLLYVSEGSRVWVETVQIDNQSLWGGRSTFSGVLIHRDGT